MHKYHSAKWWPFCLWLQCVEGALSIYSRKTWTYLWWFRANIYMNFSCYLPVLYFHCKIHLSHSIFAGSCNLTVTKCISGRIFILVPDPSARGSKWRFRHACVAGWSVESSSQIRNSNHPLWFARNMKMCAIEYKSGILWFIQFCRK